MGDEPLYCTVCGAEDGDCEHDPWVKGFEPGPYCEVCGVIPAPGLNCDTTHKPCVVPNDE